MVLNLQRLKQETTDFKEDFSGSALVKLILRVESAFTDYQELLPLSESKAHAHSVHSLCAVVMFKNFSMFWLID